MSFTAKIFDFLVSDDLGEPCFAPAGFFDVGMWEIPAHWRFTLLPGIRKAGPDSWTDPVAAVWGYAELVEDPLHGGALEGGDPSALRIFSLRLEEATKGESDDEDW